MTKRNAFVIGNGGLGDALTYVGMVNYLSAKYEHVFVACMIVYYEQIKLFFDDKHIIVYPINKHDDTTMAQFDVMMRHDSPYDVYAFGHYGSDYVDYNKFVKRHNDGRITNILHDYPISYYDDVNMTIDIMTKYFKVSYPAEIMQSYTELLDNHKKYVVVHKDGSTHSFDTVKYDNLDIDKTLTIDVNRNLYQEGHKFHDIASRFVNLKSVIYYAKLIENASALYLIDSCIHALALVVDCERAKPKICYQRITNMKYGLNKFDYFVLCGDVPIPIDKYFEK